MLFIIHTLPGEKVVMFVLPLVRPCFSGYYHFASSSLLRVGSVEIIVKNVPHVVHAVVSNFSDYI